MIEKKRCCCGVLNKTDTLNLGCKIVVITDFALAFFLMFGYIAFFTLYNTNNTWYISYTDPTKIATMDQ